MHRARWAISRRLGDHGSVPLGADADHGLAAEADLERVGDGDDLHHAGVQQPLHPLPDGGLRQPDGLPDGRVWTSTVLLQLLDDPLRQLVEHEAGPVAGGHAGIVPQGTEDRK